MKDRLEMILQKYGLSASHLAEILGVQRSGISHILSGRNNPGYEFLVSLVENFPDLNANWILTGKGKMLISEQIRKEEVARQEDKIHKQEYIQTDLFSNQNSQSNVKEINDVYNGKHSEKFIILFPDGTYQRYIPE